MFLTLVSCCISLVFWLYFGEYAYPDCIQVLLKQPLYLACILKIDQDTIRIQSSNTWDTVISIPSMHLDTVKIHTGYTYLCSLQDKARIHTKNMYPDIGASILSALTLLFKSQTWSHALFFHREDCRPSPSPFLIGIARTQCLCVCNIKWRLPYL